MASYTGAKRSEYSELVGAETRLLPFCTVPIDLRRLKNLKKE